MRLKIYLDTEKLQPLDLAILRAIGSATANQSEVSETAIAAMTELETVSEPISVEPAEPVYVEPVKSARKPRSETPRGFLNIMNMADRVYACKVASIRAANGAVMGATYAIEMRQRLEAEGLNYLSPNHRNELAQLGKEADQIRAWGIPRSVDLDDLSPSGVLYRWNHREKGRTVVNKPAEPSLRKKEPEPPPYSAPVFRDNKLQVLPLDEVFNKDLPPAEKGPVGQPVPTTVYASFKAVDRTKLSYYDSRVLRRFTEQLLRRGGRFEDFTTRQIAMAVNTIRGKELGDTPLCAVRLAALGVIIGTSGDYRLRQEYIESDYITSESV